MKNLRDKFTDEEKQQLSYLGWMLGRSNTPEEQEMENILDAMEASRSSVSPEVSAKQQSQALREGGAT